VKLPHQPDAVGIRALDERGRVDWAELEHAYGKGVTTFGSNQSLDSLGDVSGSLSLLRSDPLRGVDVLYSNICHQGTVYEATAYAVPFVAAVAAGDVSDDIRAQLLALLGEIALEGSYIAPRRSHSGAVDRRVQQLVANSLAASVDRLSHIGTPLVASLLIAIRALLSEPSDEGRDAVDFAIDALISSAGW